MGEIFKQLTDWKRSEVLRIFARFSKRPMISSMKPLSSEGIVLSAPMKGLVSAATDNNPEVRIQAILLIRSVRDRRLIPDLLGLLQHPDRALRSAGAKSIREIGPDDEQFGKIASMLSKAATPVEKKAAMAILQEIGDVRAIPYIIEDFRKNPDSPFPEAVWIIAAVNAQNPKIIDVVPCLFRLLAEDKIRRSTKESVMELLGYIADLCNSQELVEKMERHLSDAAVEFGKTNGSDLSYARMGISKIKGILGDKKDGHATKPMADRGST